MKKTLIALSLLMIGGAAFAQAPKQSRLDAIWDAADARIARQIDIWFDNGDFPKCIQLLKVQVALKPHDYEAATNLGWMQENVQDWDDALATYRDYKVQNPQDPDRALPEIDYFFRRKEYADVIPLAQSALTTKSHPNMYRILALSYERTSKLPDAERIWKQYLALAPNDGAAKHNLDRVEKKIAAPK